MSRTTPYNSGVIDSCMVGGSVGAVVVVVLLAVVVVAAVVLAVVVVVVVVVVVGMLMNTLATATVSRLGVIVNSATSRPCEDVKMLIAGPKGFVRSWTVSCRDWLSDVVVTPARLFSMAVLSCCSGAN